LITGAGRPVVRVVFTAKVSDLSNLRVVPARSRHHSPEETQGHTEYPFSYRFTTAEKLNLDTAPVGSPIRVQPLSDWRAPL
jgi:hypothetical protein